MDLYYAHILCSASLISASCMTLFSQNKSATQTSVYYFFLKINLQHKSAEDLPKPHAINHGYDSETGGELL
jgi:hypothetical protein